MNDENNEKGYMNKYEDLLEPAKKYDVPFEGEVWLSTDGKHTVRYKASTHEGRSEGGKWAKKVYDAIVEQYGTKQAQAVKEYGNKKPFSGQPKIGQEITTEPISQDTCPHDEYEVRVSSGFKKPENKGKAYKSCKRCGKFISWATVS